MSAIAESRMSLKRLIICQSFSIMHTRFDFIVFNEIKWLYAFAKYTTLKFLTKPQSAQSTYVNKLVLTPFSAFDIKCKKLNAKNFWRFIFRSFRRVSFSYSLKIAPDHGGGGRVVPRPPILFRIFVDYVTIFNSSPKQHLR